MTYGNESEALDTYGAAPDRARRISDQSAHEDSDKLE